MNHLRAARALACAGLFATASLHAAGGHHAVDDASILDPGRCHVETWIEYNRSDRGRAAIVGPACHGFGLEWTLGLSHARLDGEGDNRVAPQVKWAMETAVPGLSIGVLAGTELRARHLRRNAHFLVLPATLAFDDGDLLLHANIGRAWFAGEASSSIVPASAVEQRVHELLERVVGRLSLEPTVLAAGWRALDRD